MKQGRILGFFSNEFFPTNSNVPGYTFVLEKFNPTNKNLRGPAIEHFIDALTKKITSTAMKGDSLIYPWVYIYSLRIVGPTKDQKEAIRQHFINAGFKWEDHPDPDPGHYSSGSYSTLGG